MKDRLIDAAGLSTAVAATLGVIYAGVVGGRLGTTLNITAVVFWAFFIDCLLLMRAEDLISRNGTTSRSS